MIGSLLKELAVKTGQYFRYHSSRIVSRSPAADAPTRQSAISSEINPLNSSLPIATGLKLDLGCGKHKRPGFLGIDRRNFEGVDGVTDLTRKQWLFEQPELGGTKLQAATLDGSSGFLLPDNSVAEVHCSHFLEHLEHNQAKPERVRFMNEMWRILVPGGRATIITPHWASNRAYGDFTHADKPVSEMFYSYLDKSWRSVNAPDNDAQYNPDGYTCDFEWQLGYSIHPEIVNKPQEERDFATRWYKDAAMDLFATIIARK